MRSSFVETVLIETPIHEMVSSVKKARAVKQEQIGGAVVPIPSDAVRKGVKTEIYDGYRLGLMSACADVVCVRDSEGKLEVPLISRASPPFQGGWWPQGGAIYNFRPITQFILWKLFREAGICKGGIEAFTETHFKNNATGLSCCGVQLIVPLLGVYRTAAHDNLPGKVCDTLNVAYLALWPAGLPFGHDEDHSAMRWVTLKELYDDGYLCGHWYPQHLAIRALEIVRAVN